MKKKEISFTTIFLAHPRGINLMGDVNKENKEVDTMEPRKTNGAKQRKLSQVLH